MAAKPNFAQGRGVARYKPRAEKPSKPRLVGRAGAPSKGMAQAGKPALGAAGKGPSTRTVERVAAPMTPDSTYLGAVDLAERRGTERLGQLEGREAGIKREFGIEDPTDPFSRVNALKQTFLARGKAASVNLASQGQLNSGAHERAISRTRREEEAARAELRRAYDSAIGEVGAAKAGVKFDTEEQRAQAFEDWLARAPEGEDTSTEVPIVPNNSMFRDGPAPTAGQLNQVNPALNNPNPKGATRNANAPRESEQARAKRQREAAQRRKAAGAKENLEKAIAQAEGGPKKVNVRPKAKAKAKAKGKR